MSKFIDDLIVQPKGDGVYWTVHEPVSYQSDVLGITITIPNGYVTDGASIPKLFWNIVSPVGPYFFSAVFHDYGYRWQKFPRRKVDDAFLEGMWVLKCKVWQYVVIYLAVRLFGAHAWKKDAKMPLADWELEPNKDVKV